MKTYCVITRDNSYTIQAEDVFVVDASIPLSEKALQIAMHFGRPLSLRVPWGWVTHNVERIPFTVGGERLRKKVPISRPVSLVK
jgi:hypothetical protein